jgi:hypothetical protein
MLANRIGSPLLEVGRLGMKLMLVLDEGELHLDSVWMLLDSADAAVGRAQLYAALFLIALVVYMLVSLELYVN